MEDAKRYIPIPLIVILILVTGAVTPSSWAANPVPTEDSYFYYEIGGAKAIGPPLNPHVIVSPLGAEASFSLGYSCGKFDPMLSIDNFLDRARRGMDDMANQAVSAANAAIAALPMMILARANPDLMKIFEQALMRAEANYQLSHQSCKQMEQEIRAGNNPYEDWVSLSASRDWKMQMALGGDITEAEKTIEANLGTKGVPWIGGRSAGGVDQPPIRPVRDVAKAGYNITANRDVTNSAPLPAGVLPSLSQHWSKPSDFQEWVIKVVGDNDIQTFDGSQKTSTPGVGLGPEIGAYTGSLAADLTRLVNGTKPLSLPNLEAVSPPGTTITRQVIEAIQALPNEEQSIVISRLADETAVQTVTNKALAARRLLITGQHEPNVIGAGKNVLVELDRKVVDLERAIGDALFEERTRKELVASTVLTVLRKDETRKRSAKNAPVQSSSDPRVLERGAIK